MDEGLSISVSVELLIFCIKFCNGKKKGEGGESVKRIGKLHSGVPDFSMLASFACLFVCHSLYYF